MTTKEILQSLKIDRTSPESLKSQLEKQLEALIGRLDAETVLPPERSISEFLQISRVTVRNALNKFYVNGSIIRHGRLGTTIAQKKRPNPVQLNPFILGMDHEIMHHMPIRFMLYEDLPIQKNFWEKVVKDYNDRTENSSVELVWMDCNKALNDLQGTLVSEKIDLLMISSYFHLDRDFNFVKLPEKLKRYENSDSYIFKDLNLDLTYFIPFYLSTPVILWNQELAEQLNIKDIPEKINRGDLLPLLQESAKKLPDGYLSGVRIWDCLHFMMPPDTFKDQNKLYPCLKELVQVGKSAGKDIDKLFVFDQKYKFDNLESFLNGERLFLLTHISHLQVMDPPRFRHGFLTFPNQKNLSAQLLKIGICKNCLDIHGAAEFLNYLLSPEVQKLCAEEKENFPVHKEFLIEHLKNKYHQTGQMPEKYIRNLVPYNNDDPNVECFSGLVIYYLREELKELLHGTISAEAFLEAAKKKYTILKSREAVQKKKVV